MAILIMCNNQDCGEFFEVGDEHGGHVVTCPQCGLQQKAPVNTARSSQPPATEPSNKLFDLTSTKIEYKETEQDQSVFDSTFELADIDEEDGDIKMVPVSESQPPEPPIVIEDQKTDNVQLSSASSEGNPSDRSLSSVDTRSIDEGIEALEKLKVDCKQPSAVSDDDSKSSDEQGDADSDKECAFAFQKESSILDLDDNLSIEEPYQVAEDESSAPRNRIATVAVLSVGLLGMVVGAIFAGFSFPDNLLVAIYSGAGCGWVVGFVIMFLVVISDDRESTDKVRCYLCGSEFPDEVDSCPVCGLDLDTHQLAPLILLYLRSWKYAVSNVRSLLMIAFLTGLWSIIWIGGDHLRQSLSEDKKGVGLGLHILVTALFGFLVFSCWMEYIRRSLNRTFQNLDKAPSTPSPLSFSAGIKGLKIFGAYLVPMLSFPLMPLGVLSIAPTKKGQVFRMRNAIATIWQNPKGYEILWLLILLWLACMALGLIILSTFYRLVLIRCQQLEDAFAIGVTETFVGMFFCILGAIIVSVFVLAISRCIGIFGRHNLSGVYVQEDQDNQAN